MQYFELVPADPTPDIWLFFDPAAEVLRVLPQYEPFQCRGCGKLDELAALSEVGVHSLHIQTRRDFFGTCDDFDVCSAAFVAAYEDAGLSGLRFLPVPSAPGFSVLLPTLIQPVDLPVAGFEFHGGRCGICGRHREAVVGPLVESIQKPADPLAIFTGDHWNESIGGKRMLLFCSERAKKALAHYRLRGLELIHA